MLLDFLRHRRDAAAKSNVLRMLVGFQVRSRLVQLLLSVRVASSKLVSPLSRNGFRSGEILSAALSPVVSPAIVAVPTCTVSRSGYSGWEASSCTDILASSLARELIGVNSNLATDPFHPRVPVGRRAACVNLRCARRNTGSHRPRKGNRSVPPRGEGIADRIRRMGVGAHGIHFCPICTVVRAGIHLHQASFATLVRRTTRRPCGKPTARLPHCADKPPGLWVKNRARERGRIGWGTERL